MNWVCFWTVVLAFTAWFHAWNYLLIGYGMPALLAGNMHSLRKYIEHMGLTGSKVRTLTRSVVSDSLLGRLFAFSMFNIQFHGIHHHFGSMPQASLPRFAVLLFPVAEERGTYRNYAAALLEMIPTLADPRVGSQWLEASVSRPLDH